MDNQTNWYGFTDGLGEISCKRIIHTAEDKWYPAEIGQQYDLAPEDKVSIENVPTSSKSNVRKSEETRLCEISWTEDKWIYDAIWPYMEEANVASGWGYSIMYAEPMQITKYDKDGFYGWHKDGKSDHLSKYNLPNNGYMHDKVRKLSMSISLNDDYEGGDLEFAFYQRGECTIKKAETNNIGNTIVFPSYQEHRITPVTKGTKYSLVVWFIGPPFV